MAIIYGKSSRYLLKNDAKYYFLAMGLALLPLGVVWLLYKFSSPAASGIGALILIAVLIKVIEPIIGIFKARSGKFYRGRGGEQDIRRLLAGLPDEYIVFQDLNFPGQRGNIDFAVVGPTGIFALEVKSHKGRIGFNGFEVTLNGRLFPERNILKQACGGAIRLRNFFRQTTGADIFVKASLVFSRGYGLRFGLKPVENVYIAGKDYLLGLITGQPLYYYPVPKEQLAEKLRSLVSG